MIPLKTSPSQRSVCLGDLIIYHLNTDNLRVKVAGNGKMPAEWAHTEVVLGQHIAGHAGHMEPLGIGS